MTTKSQAKQAYDLLERVLFILDMHHETNWRRGIQAAINELVNPDGNLNVQGFENSRSIYRSMVNGGRGFAEYYINFDDAAKTIQANQTLDALRDDLWRIFNV